MSLWQPTFADVDYIANALANIYASTVDIIEKAKGPKAAGIVVRADDTGRVLMVQRAITNHSQAAGQWEWPGGRLKGDDTPWDAAQREFQEEVGQPLPDGKKKGTWTSPDGRYVGFVYVVDSETTFKKFKSTGDENSNVAWWNPKDLPGNPAVRIEVQGSTWSLIGHANKNVSSSPQQSTLQKAADLKALARKGKPLSPKAAQAKQHALADKIEKHYAPRLTAAMRNVSGAKAAIDAVAKMPQMKAILEQETKALSNSAFSGMTAAQRATFRQAVQNVIGPAITFTTKAVLNVLEDMGRDAFISGAADAAESMGLLTAIVAGIKIVGMTWDKWEPGAPDASRIVASTGLNDLLDSYDVTIKGMNDTSIASIGDIIATGLATGANATTIASNVTDFLGPAATLVATRAMLITRTECNRAQNTANFEAMKNAGYTTWRLICSQLPCPHCQELEEESADTPFSVTTVTNAPPIHPNCKCTVRAVFTKTIEDLITNTGLTAIATGERTRANTTIPVEPSEENPTATTTNKMFVAKETTRPRDARGRYMSTGGSTDKKTRPTGTRTSVGGKPKTTQTRTTSKRPPVGKFQLTDKEIQKLNKIWEDGSRPRVNVSTAIAQMLGHTQGAQLITETDIKKATPKDVIYRGCNETGAKALLDGCPPPLNGNGGMLYGPGVYFTRDAQVADGYNDGTLIKGLLRTDARVLTISADSTPERTPQVLALQAAVLTKMWILRDTGARNLFDLCKRTIGLQAMLCGYQAIDWSPSDDCLHAVTLLDKSVVRAVVTKGETE